jgi:hypothetical protein
MEATCFSEASVDFQQTTRRYIPEDRELFTTTGVRTSNPTNTVLPVSQEHQHGDFAYHRMLKTEFSNFLLMTYAKCHHDAH